MSDARGCRQNAAECLLAAYEVRQPCYRKLNLSIATLWLAFAHQDQAIGNLLASWAIAEPTKTGGRVSAANALHVAFDLPRGHLMRHEVSVPAE
jgi:hypothetical protein